MWRGFDAACGRHCRAWFGGELAVTGAEFVSAWGFEPVDLRFKLAMGKGANGSLEDRSVDELVALVRTPIGEVERLRVENREGQARFEALCRENLELKDEVRRPKGLPLRPPAQSTGMEKAADPAARAALNPELPLRRRPGGC